MEIIDKIRFNTGKTKQNVRKSTLSFAGSNVFVQKQPDGTNKTLVNFFVPAKKHSNPTLNYKDFTTNETKSVVLNDSNYSNGNYSTTVELNDPTKRLGYNFNINGKTIVDLTEQTSDGKFALTIDPNLNSFERNHTIYQILPDSFNSANSENLFDKNGVTKNWRNHFDLYGGNLKGIMEKLDIIKSEGFGRIMGTPVFGKDISSNGYWTVNPFQISPKMGNVDDFEKLNIELFKRGMGWIADGAFVNQGLMGVQFQDLLRSTQKNKEADSPYKDWFVSVYNRSDYGENKNIGVLPQDAFGKPIKEAYDFRFINSPIDMEGNINPDYVSKMPTYIELFDPRGEGINRPVSVQSSQDSVQNYKFPIDKQELKDKINQYKKGEIPKDAFLSWSNFNLTTSDRAAGFQLWDGNRDVLKINTQNPQVKKYIMKAGEYWTTRIDNALLKYVTNSIVEKLGNKEPNAENISNAIKDLEVQGVFPKDSYDRVKGSLDSAINDTNIARINDSNLDAIKAYPLDSIEFPNEICAILSNPVFKDLMDKDFYPAVTKFIENDILKSPKITDQNKVLTPEISRMFIHDTLKSLVIKALSNLDHMPGDNIPDDWNNKLATATIDKLPENIFEGMPSVTAQLFNNTLMQGLKEIQKNQEYKDKLAESINKTIQKVNVPVIRSAKSLLTAMESGLDWRIDAAKDVADMDAVRNGNLSPFKAYRFVKDFWLEFYETVNKINPKVYMIGEVTSTPSDYFTNRFLSNSLDGKVSDNDKLLMEKVITSDNSSKLTDEEYNKLKELILNTAYGSLMNNPDEGYKRSELAKLPKFLTSKNLSEVNETEFAELKDMLSLITSKPCFSTVSNYRYMYGAINKLHHAHPEPIYGWHYGPSGFFGELEEFIKAWPLSAVNTAHNIVDNHDKSRILHSLLIHPGKFMDQGNPNGPRDAMTDVLVYGLNKTSGIDENTKTKLASGIKNAANKAGNNFGYWPLERALTAAVKESGIDDYSISDKVSKTLFSEIADKYLRMAYTQTGIPGAFEVYSGTELGMTGGETPSKNVYLQNRNPLPWIWLNDSNKPEIKEFNNKIKSIFSMRSNNNLSALNTGFATKITTDDGNGILSFLRYNNDSQVLVIVNEGCVNCSGNAESGVVGNLPVTRPSINNYQSLNLGYAGIDVGTVFVNGEDTSDKYIVWSDGILRKKPDNVNSPDDMRYYYGTPEGPTIQQGMILYRENQKVNALQDVSFGAKNKKLNLFV